MRDRSLGDLAAEMAAGVDAIKAYWRGPVDADRLEAASHLAKRLIDVAQTFADQADRLAAPPEVEEEGEADG